MRTIVLIVYVWCKLDLLEHIQSVRNYLSILITIMYLRKNMESVYFYEDNVSKDVLKILEDDFFKRIGFVVRECTLLGSQRKGYFLYIKANSENIDRVEEKFKGIGLYKLIGEEKKIITNAFIAEEENAASGMGMIFG